MRELLSGDEYDQMLARLDEKVMNDLINEALVVQKASEYAMTVPESAIDEAIDKLKEENHITTPEEFEQALLAIGMTAEELRENMRNRFLRNSLLEQEVKSKIILTQSEIEAYYQEHREEYRILPSVKLRQVFFRTDQMAPAEAREECVKIKREIEGGGDFAEIAGRYADPEQETGNDILGPFSKGDLLEDIEEAAFSLAVGEVSDVLETEYGLYIIQVVEKDAGGYQALPEVSQEIREMIYRQMSNDGVEEYLEKLKEEIYVEILTKS
jgi:parvulin-like peptidyl-prolyl isomerase